MENTKQEPQRQIVRQTAKVASIKEINSGKYIKQDGWEPNYVLSIKNEKLSRVNIIGIVVTMPENKQSVFIDDGSSKIEIRTFEENNIFKNITIGDVVLIVGRPREFNEEIYVNAEIIKKISNNGWVEYRKKEITLKNLSMPDINVPTEEKIKNNSTHNIKTPQDSNNEFNEEIDDIDALLLKIKDLDSGNGCDVQDLINIDSNYENIIEQLLLKGEIFELGPGKIKVLE